VAVTVTPKQHHGTNSVAETEEGKGFPPRVTESWPVSPKAASHQQAIRLSLKTIQKALFTRYNDIFLVLGDTNMRTDTDLSQSTYMASFIMLFPQMPKF
jgi:hypothetical protein